MSKSADRSGRWTSILQNIEKEQQGMWAAEQSSLQQRSVVQQYVPEKRQKYLLIQALNAQKKHIENFLKVMNADKKSGDPKKIEIEASFGKFAETKQKGKSLNFTSGFRSNFRFQLVKDYLENIGLTKVTEIYEVEVDNHGVRRKNVDGQYLYERKIRHYDSGVNITSHGVRIVTSNEEEIGEPADFITTVKRSINRTKFTSKEKDSPFYGFNVDLSDIVETHIEKNKKPYSFRKYEVEIEVTKSKNVDNFIHLINVVYGLSLGIVPEYEAKDISDNSDIRKSVHLFNSLLNLDERRPQFTSRVPYSEKTNILKQKYRQLTDEPQMEENIQEKTRQFRPKIYNPDNLISHFWNKPITLQIKHLIKPKTYQVTLKYDGQRCFLFACYNRIYLCMPPYTIIEIGTTNLNSVSLLDGELMTRKSSGKLYYEFWAFDILFHQTDLRNKLFHERFGLAKIIIDSCHAYQLFKLYVKPYITAPPTLRGENDPSEFYELAKRALEEYANSKEELDGIIFQSAGTYYEETLKWKPPDKMTIEFLFKRKEEANDFTYILHVKRGKDYVPFLINGEDVQVETQENLYTDKIVECGWDGTSFVPHRIRNDRDKPNALEVAQANWKIIQSPVDKKTLQGKTLQVMRKLHNKAKERFLSERQYNDILDIGSGRGGDLDKWVKYNKRVFVVEPDEDNMSVLEDRLEQIEKRYKNKNAVMPTEIIPINHGAQQTDKIVETLRERQLDRVPLITAFFSLMYFPKDDAMYSGLLDTINVTLEYDGEFVGIIMDGDRVRKALAEGTLDNEVFSITKKTEFKHQPFGNAVRVKLMDDTTMVKGHKEYLFDFDHFVKKLRELNIRLKGTGFLDTEEYKGLSKLPAKFSSLFRWFVFVREKKSSVNILTVDKILPLKISANNFEYVGVIQNEENLLHCILYLFDKNYVTSDKESKMKQAKIIRSKLSALATPQFAVANPKLFGKISTPMEGVKKLIDYKLKILDMTKPLEARDIPLLEFIFKFNITVIKQTETKDQLKYYFARKSVTHKRSIILLTSDDVHFQPVIKRKGDRTTNVFDKDIVTDLHL